MSEFNVIPDVDIFGSRRTHRRIRLAKRFKVLILKVQRGKCARCHKSLSLAMAEFDHKKALGAGGSNRIDNWQALHPNCHRMKTKKDVKKAAARRKRMNRYRSPFTSSRFG